MTVLGAPEAAVDRTRRLAGLWRAALEIDADGDTAGSFFELGGYSLLALSLAERIGREFGVEAPRTLVFEYDSLDRLLEWLETAAAEPTGDAPPIAPPAGPGPEGGPGLGARPGSDARTEARADARTETGAGARTESRAGASAVAAAGSAPVRFPLSQLQQAYLVGEHSGLPLSGPAVFHEEYHCDPFDVAALRTALTALAERHPMLRARFHEDGTQSAGPVAGACPVEFRDLSGLSPEEAEQALRASLAELRAERPEPESGINLRLRVLDLGPFYRVQVWGRLLVFDGQSGTVFADELRTLLDGGSLQPLEYDYAAYRHAVEAERGSRAHAAARAYWTERAGRLPASPVLPSRPGRGGTDDGPVTRRSFLLPADVWERFGALVRAQGLTPATALGAAFCEILGHWSKDQHFVLNVMYGERRPYHPHVDRVVGNFSSTLLLERGPRTPGGTFAERAAELRDRLHEGLEHGILGGVEVLREANRSSRRLDGVAAVVFAPVLGPGTRGGVFLERLGWRRIQGGVHTPQVAFDHQVFELATGLLVNWDTLDGRFPDGLVEEMFTAYRELLTELAASPQAWKRTSFDLTPPGGPAARRTANDTRVPRAPATLHGLFRERLAEHPERPAVLGGERTVSYAELDAHARSVADALAAAGHAPGEPVGVVAARDWRQVAALLGVLYHGGAYVPLAPDWPERRHRQVIERAGLRTVLAAPGFLADGPGRPAVIDLAAALVPAPGDRSGAPLPVAEDPEALAYVLFTSGTTGVPKGVMIRHESAANTLRDISGRCGVGPGDRLLMVSEYTFDLSVYDVFGALAAGAAVIAADVPRGEIGDLYRLAADHGATVWNSVPAYFGLLADYVRSGGHAPLGSLRHVLLSGDWVPLNVTDDLAVVAPEARCLALGGATEASVWSNVQEVPRGGVPADWTSVPYGRPLENQYYAVLDEEFADRPDWVPGELYIGGRGLADGYLNAPETTARAFLTRPGTGERLYRTGDRGRYWPDGTLEFLGREDQQTKVNGFRVELGEIETHLLGCPGVAEAIVLAQPSAGGSALVAHLVPRPGTDGADLPALARRHLRDTLPPQLVPRGYRVHPRFPLTGNGKVDRAALAGDSAPYSVSGSGADTAPDTASGISPDTGTARPAGDRPAALPAASGPGAVVLRLWAELLGPATPDSDFFDQGGDSLTAARMMNRLEAELGIRLPLTALYEAATPAGLTTLLTEAAPAAVPCLSRLSAAGGPPLVLVHPVGGDVLCYRPLLTRLARTYTVWGLRAPGTLGERPPLGSVAALAREYATELRPLFADGSPVRLAGWSFGSVVAHETARLLTTGADAVAARADVVMLDPWLADGDTAAGEDELIRSFFVNLSGGRAAVPARPLAGLTGEAALARALDLATAAHPALGSLTAGSLRTLYALYRAHSQALAGHRFTPHGAVRTHVLESEQGLGGPAGRYLRPLSRVAAAHAGPGAPRFHHVPGDHFSIVAEERADLVAGLILGSVSDR
ncbi:amino acid adenylation domain-containing protein [Streptomyces venezuelae]|uniref:non-ribosomal peptide synthetase n=1 Tax=Streptomyces venezuelae TaxID=54571 RepID=UPI00123C0650|nr:non-ribosomal peptide synthetase [Streptomyces venezuelae]QES09278.1 amino acid adenylation domain-containing protein [Streptomyces venezuelae]